jgi:hypothetical protein
MKCFMFFCLLLLGRLAATAQQWPSQNGPSVKVSFPNTLHSAKAENVCAVDFRNIRLVRNAHFAARLRGGKYDHRESGGFKSVRLKSIDCMDDQDGVPRYAIVKSEWAYGGGSANDECVVQLFMLRSGNLVVTQQLEFDCSALTTGATLDTKSQKLTVRARSDEPSAHCCAKSLDVVTYLWHDNRFIRSGFRRVPAVVEKSADGLEYH